MPGSSFRDAIALRRVNVMRSRGELQYRRAAAARLAQQLADASEAESAPCTCAICDIRRRAEAGATIDRQEIADGVRDAMRKGRVRVLGGMPLGLTEDAAADMLVEGISAMLSGGPRPGDDEPPQKH